MNPVPSQVELTYLHLINEIFDYKTSLDSHGQDSVSGDVCWRADLKGPVKGFLKLGLSATGQIKKSFVWVHTLSSVIPFIDSARHRSPGVV